MTPRRLSLSILLPVSLLVACGGARQGTPTSAPVQSSATPAASAGGTTPASNPTSAGPADASAGTATSTALPGPPPAPATLPAPPGNPVAEAFLHFVTPQHVGIEVSVGGKSALFLLDSGATQTVLDRDFAAQAGVKAQGGLAAAGVGAGTSTVALGHGSVDLGSVELEKGLLTVMDLGDLLHARISPEVSGILGQGIFRKYIVDIDYAQSVVRFYAPGTLPKESLAKAVTLDLQKTPLPFALIAGRFKTKAGLVDLRAVLDTGAGTPFYFFGPKVGKEALGGKHTVDVTVVAGIGGTSTMTLARGGQLDLGPWTFADLPFQVSKDGNKIFTRFGIDAAIGPVALWGPRSRIVFDEPAGRVYVFGAPGGTIKSYTEDRSGLFLKRSGDQVVIDTVAPDSPAARAGLKAGDVITAVNGAPPPSLTVLAFAMAQPAGTTVTLTVASPGGAPREVPLELAPYPM